MGGAGRGLGGQPGLGLRGLPVMGGAAHGLLVRPEVPCLELLGLRGG